jgi:periplasmic divalent cation tolerance protein
MAEIGLVLVTVDTQETGIAIAEQLVSARLAACVNLYPIHSIYMWNEELQQEGEWQLAIKTNLAQFDTLEATLRELHPYSLPEILALPVVKGSVPYLQWVAEETDIRKS